MSGGYDIDVNLASKYSSDSLYPAMAITYKTLYNPNTLLIKNVNVYVAVLDKFGVPTSGYLINTSLTSNVARKISWKANNLPFQLQSLLNCTGRYCARNAPGPAVW